VASGAKLFLKVPSKTLNGASPLFPTFGESEC